MSGDDDFDAAEAALFGLVPAEFVAARNALAARLKAAGRRDDAARVKALPRPPASAWAVNQLFWRARGFLERLLDAGETLRAAQQAGGEELREALRARREATALARDRALGFLRESGQGVTPALEQRVSHTLLALATHGRRAPAEAVSGRLHDDLEPPGFEALDGLTVPERPQPPPPASVAPPPAVVAAATAAPVEPAATDAAERERAERAAREAAAERRAGEIRRQRERHEAAALALRAAEESATSAGADVERRRGELALAEQALARATAAVADARAALERADADLRHATAE